MVRRLRFDDAGPVCAAAHYNEIQPALVRIINALRGQILYK
jgi:hypothetical protein